MLMSLHWYGKYRADWPTPLREHISGQLANVGETGASCYNLKSLCENYVRCIISVNVYVKCIIHVNKMYHTIDSPYCG